MQSKVSILSLGCAKNLVDSEIMLGSLRQEGFAIVEEPEEANVLIINTCSFIGDAKKESIDAIQSAAAAKHGTRQKLMVAGCLAQRYRAELPSLMPEVDGFIGLDQVAKAGPLVAEMMQKTRARDAQAFTSFSEKSTYIPDYTTPRVRLTPKHTAYVKIAEGCNHTCSFCAIPRFRGMHRSRAQADVVAEVKALVEAGCKEINLISQDTTYFGMDKWEGSRPKPWSPVDSSRGESLSTLLRELNEIPGDFWIRPLYTHPAHWSEELMETWAQCEKVAKYIDVPFQHVSDPMLKVMRRETDKAHLVNLVKNLRAKIPNLMIRSTFIVGFPGESEGDFAEILEFIKDSGIERGGIFAYSREEDTRAYDLGDQIHHATKVKRRNLATDALYNIAQARGEKLIGQTIKVLVESPGVARSQWDAPDVDGTVDVDKSLPVGEFAEVEIEDALGYQLFAKGA